MDKSLREHLFLSSLKKLNRDYITKETTSLLMKELDELRSSSSPSTIITPGGVAGSSHTLAHYYKPNNGSTQGHRSSDGSTSSDHHPPPPGPNQPGESEPTKTDSHSVARAILHAVRVRRKDKALSAPNFTNKKGQFPLASSENSVNNNQQLPLLNGNATEEEIRQANLNRSPVISKSNRLTKRFQLEFKPHIFSGRFRDKNKRSPNRASSLETVEREGLGSSKNKIAGSVENTPTKEPNKEENEHGLIAYKSALLHTEIKSPTGASSGTPGSQSITTPPSPPPNSGHPTLVEVNLRNRSSAEPTSAESSPKPGTSTGYNTIYRRPHSVGTMHDNPSNIPQNMVPNDSFSIPDEEFRPETSTDHTITSGHFSVVTDAGTAMPTCCAACSPSTESFLSFRNRFCTSYKLKVPNLRNPVDVCLLPNDCLAIADYDNGFLILNPSGDVVKHCTPGPEGRNACGIACSTVDSEFRLLVLGYKEGAWSINVYDWTFELAESIPCPQDSQIETWALRKIVLAPPIGGGVWDQAVGGEIEPDIVHVPSCALYLMASGETKSMIWSFDFVFRQWKMIVSENSRRGAYNDLSIKFDSQLKETHFLLCDWKKAQLGTVVVNELLELVDNQTIKIRRVKGQEWIVQGPKLAIWDEHSDVLVYDGSGKLFLFDGETHKCKKIIGDLGRGEISALVVGNGWCYALCRYRLCIEAFLYNELSETSL